MSRLADVLKQLLPLFLAVYHCGLHVVKQVIPDFSVSFSILNP